MISDTPHEPSDDFSTDRPPAPLDPCCEGLRALRVAGASVPRKVAGAIAKQIRQSGCAELHAVGPEAVNQTVKSIALAKNYLLEDKIRIVLELDFMQVKINDSIRNGVRFCVTISSDGREPDAT